MRDNSKRNFISKRPTAFIRVRSVIFSLIKTEEIIRSLSCKNPFCTIVSGLRFPKEREEQIPTAIREETTKRVNCHKNGNSPPILHRKRHTRRSFIRSFCVCLDGLPDRIRTCDLQSRSLTRYPAVPRVDTHCIVAQFFRKVNR